MDERGAKGRALYKHADSERMSIREEMEEQGVRA
jgi:hypothetical protein